MSNDNLNMTNKILSNKMEEEGKATTYDPAVKVKNKPKVVRGKAKTERVDAEKAKRAKQMKRLQQTGKAEDAASLFEDFVEL